MKSPKNLFLATIPVFLLFFCPVNSQSQGIQLSSKVVGTYQSFSTDERSYQSFTGSLPVPSFSSGQLQKLTVLYSSGHVVSVSPPTDIEAPLIYPNPSEGIFRIREFELFGNTEFVIYSIYGSYLTSRQVDEGKIDISELASGAYILILKDHYGNTWHYRLLKI